METGVNINESREFFFRRRRILSPDFTWSKSFHREPLDRDPEISVYIMGKRKT